MKFREYQPHDLLRDDVRCFWILDTEYPEDGHEDVTPDGCVELILSFGQPYRSPETGRPLPTAFLVGMQNRTVRFPVSGRVRLVAARLHPWAARSLLSDGAGIAADAIADLGPHWGEAWGRLVADARDLVGRGAYDAAARRLEATLIERALEREMEPAVVRAAARLIHMTKGQCRIEDVADHCNISIRQLQRGFQQVVGATPKGFARAVRFAAAQRALLLEPDTDLTDLAYRCGYADQAHFSRDFKELAGTTPGDYARRTRMLRDQLASRDVVFLQSDGDPAC